MILFRKPRRVINNEEENNDEKYKEYYYNNKVSNDKNNLGKCTILTVWRKSLLVSCSGFTVIDSNGNLVYRVDNYFGRLGEIVLMDGSGKSLLTMRRHKTLRLVHDWVIYNGNDSNAENKKITRYNKKQQIIGYVKKSISLLQANSSNEIAQVYLGTSSSFSNKKPTYVIQGSYAQRYCKVFDKSSMSIVAEIKMKEAMNNGSASMGFEVFRLVVAPGFDTGFAMALVLLLDQMYS